MPIITREPIEAFAHCAQMAEPGVRCPGYEQQPVPGIRETIAYLYSDSWGGPGPGLTPHDVALQSITERTVERVIFADESDRPCPFCGMPREVSDQVRPQYDRLDDQHPDELLARQRRQTEAALTTASAAERQAVALEALVEQGAQAAEIEQLRELVAQQTEQIGMLLARLEVEPANGNGGEAAAPKPARKRAEG